MPLIPYFKARRIWKAKRAASLRGRPAWQTVLPDTKQGRDSYAIAAKHEDMFAKAFMAAMAEMITPEIERDFREAWKSGSPAAVINSIPYFDENPDSKVWAKFLGRLGKAYATVIQAAGDAASRDLQTQFGVKQTFTTLPPPDQADDLVGEVTEGLVKKADAWRQAAAGMTVDVNPYSIKWIEDHGLDLVQQGISVQQKKVVTNIIQSSMEQGLRPTDAISEIKANIGLTDRAYNATVRDRKSVV